MTFSSEHVSARAETMTSEALKIAGTDGLPEAYSAFPTITLPSFTDGTAGQWTAFVNGADANARSLQAMLDRVSEAGGGTVFFPPGRYYIGRSEGSRLDTPTTDAPDILVHPNVVLEFAPGAVLVPVNFATARSNLRPRVGRPDEEPLVIIEVQGAIRAGLHAIFSTTLYPRNDTAPYEPDLLAGKVFFTGNQVREVYPEWWEVFTQIEGHWGVRNRRAFQAAIDAGHTDRYRLVRRPGGELRSPMAPEWRQESTIPVVAMYEYYIEGGLEVGLSGAIARLADPALRRANPAPFVMRGGCEPTIDTATLRAMEDPARPPGPEGSLWGKAPMLTMREVSSFYFEEVSFNCNYVAFGAVDITPGARGGIGEFNRCMFQYVCHREEATLVTIHTPPGRETDPIGEAVHIAFTACRMTPIKLNDRPPGELNAPGHFTYVPRVRGLVLDYDDRCSVELRACHLQGVCDPMIHARQGRFAINECVFHGMRRIQTLAPTTNSSVEWRRFWNSTNGTDIFIDRPLQIGGRDAAPASFTSRETEVQSFQFVSTWMDGDPAAERRPGARPSGQRASYVLINTHHSAAPAGSHEGDTSQGAATGGGADPHPFSAKQFRPSISWEGPGQIGCHLVAIGCCLRSRYLGAHGLYSAHLGGIRLGPDHMGTIFHIANTTIDRLEDRGSYQVTPTQLGPPSFLRADAPVELRGVRVPALQNVGVERI